MRLVVVMAVLLLAVAGCEAATSPRPGGETGAGDDRLSVSTEGWTTDFSKRTVSLAQFQSGGPGKDGIPAIDKPRFVSVKEADGWLADEEPVIELVVGGSARAYPLQILVWHEIVNDDIDGVPVAVTFCPLCNTALVFDRRLDGRLLDFGTTGNLRNSDLVMYDRQTESWWQQFGGEALVGDLAGAKLTQLPARIAAWDDFARRYRDGEVLSRDTGFTRPYGQNPYAGYDDVSTGPLFPVGREDSRLPPKERVVFLERGEDAVVIPFRVLAKRKEIEVEVGGQRIDVEWVPAVRSPLDAPALAEGREVGSARATSAADGSAVSFDQPFWFAVAAFRPGIRIVGSEQTAAGRVRSAPPATPRRRTAGRVIPSA